MDTYKPLPVVQRGQVLLELERDIDPLPTMTAYVEANQCYQFADAAYREFFQLLPEQITGRQVRDVLGAKAYETIRPYMEKAVSGQSLAFDARMYINGSCEHYCRTTLIPRKDGDRVDGVYILVSDLTELKHNEQKFQRLLESTEAIPWEADAKTWQFTYVGRQAKEILGYPIEHWYEQNFWPQHIHPDDKEFAITFCETSSREKTDYEFEYRMQHADGHTVWLHDIVNVESLNGEPVALRGYMIDVTERKRMEEELRTAHTQLEERVRQATKANAELQQEIIERKKIEEDLRKSVTESKQKREELAHVLRMATMSELTATLSHEINQPLAAIRMNAQAAKRLMQADAFDFQEFGEIIDDIIGDSQRAAEVIRRIREWLKSHVVDAQPLNIAKIINDVISLIHSDAVIKNVEVVLDLVEDLPHVSGDAIQLQQVFLNLILNGFDAMQNVPIRERRLVIQTALQGENTVCVSVQDTGVGFKELDADRLFEPFRTTKADGLGMGLAINRSIIEAHGGKIWARENADRGATFQFTLPVLSGL